LPGREREREDVASCHARLQPDLNVRIPIPHDARTIGINDEAVRGFVSGLLGIKILNKLNYLHTERKVCSAINPTGIGFRPDNPAKNTGFRF
jgi:hypothetical protein